MGYVNLPAGAPGQSGFQHACYDWASQRAPAACNVYAMSRVPRLTGPLTMRNRHVPCVMCHVSNARVRALRPAPQAAALHGEQYLELRAPLPPSGRLVSRPELVDIQGKGACGRGVGTRKPRGTV